MTDRYAVFGNPIGHSRSPAIHRLFAASTGQDITYEAILAPLDGFAETIRRQAAAGLRGANVTVPFKEEAWRLSTRRTPRADLAGAVNTLSFEPADIVGDNTDGAGLVRDLTRNLGVRVAGTRILLLGAGGAARGVLEPLLAESPAMLVIANRTAEKAATLALRFADLGPVRGAGYDILDDAGIAPFDLVVNATSASLGGTLPPVPPRCFAAGAMAYDLMYGAADTPFIAFARGLGVTRFADGLGMLVEQAAEAFFAWRDVRPPTAPVLAELRRQIGR